MLAEAKHSPQRYLWSSYDADADVLHVNFRDPSHADDSELADDAIVRGEAWEVAGLTIQNASKRDNAAEGADSGAVTSRDEQSRSD